jgi:hypothetical protein
MLLRLLEFVLGVLFVLMMVTQVIIPSARGLPVFPIFRKRKLERDLTLAQGLIDRAKTKKEISKIKGEVVKINKKR